LEQLLFLVQLLKLSAKCSKMYLKTVRKRKFKKMEGEALGPSSPFLAQPIYTLPPWATRHVVADERWAWAVARSSDRLHLVGMPPRSPTCPLTSSLPLPAQPCSSCAMAERHCHRRTKLNRSRRSKHSAGHLILTEIQAQC
jgi:hypothetical protein